MLVPLHGFVRGDTVGLLVLVHDTDTIEQVAETLMAAAAVRLPPAPRARVYRGQEELPAEQTVAGAGLSALECVDLIPEWSTERSIPEGRVPERTISDGRVPERTGAGEAR